MLLSTKKYELDKLNDSIRLQMHPNLVMNVDYLSALQQAIGNKTIIAIEYKDAKDELTSRKLEPIGLIFYAFNWHLIGWCHTRQDYRDFKVARITNLRNLGLPFQRSSHVELAEFMKSLPVNY